VKKCDEKDLISFANIVAWPNTKSTELISEITNPSENHIIELYFFETNTLIGGYIAKFIPGYQVIYLKEISIVPSLKSKIYGREMVERLGKIGLDIYGANFKGIVATSKCKQTKKSFDESSKYKIRALINAGGDIIVECAKIKNQILHLIFIPYNGGLEQNEVEEIFTKIIKT
jgi:hypothetical protein